MALRQLILREQVAATVRSGQDVSIGTADLLVLTSTCAQLVHACLLNEPLALTQEQVRSVHEATLRALEALQRGRARERGDEEWRAA